MQKILPGPAGIFAIFWCLLFLLYLPAAHCGWVSDTLGWLDAVRHQSFAEYINRTHFGVHSFYQTTQFVTWCLYQVFGANHWAWHIIHLSLHALNCTLLYALCRGMLSDSGFPRSAEISFAATLLFCTSPYVSEVIVWEAAFHYLQGMLFILTILNLLRSFLRRPRMILAIAACLLFGLSVFSLELFYLTPLLTALLLIFYRISLRHDKAIIRRGFLYFLLPQIVLFVCHLALVRGVYGTSSARLGDALLHMPVTYYAVRPPDYFFHLLGGRFLPQALRSAAHRAFCTYAGAGIFYLALISMLAYVVFFFKKMQRRGQLTSLFFICMMSAMALVTPMWFPERLLIAGDRYLYVILPFFFATSALLISGIRSTAIQRVVLGCTTLLQCAGTLCLSMLWARSQAITDALQSGFSAPADKIVLLLNNPQSLKGAPMIGAGTDGELKLMHNLLYTPPVAGNAADVLACDLTSVTDSMSIRVLNDYTVSVKLLQPGSRWWYGSDYAESRTAPDFSVRLVSPDTYILSLKSDPRNFSLKYRQRDAWKTVDMHHHEMVQR